jgi:hypothetical protein
MAMQALVMGFGGTGAHILTALKELTVLKAGKVPDSIKFLFFDTIADWKPGNTVQIVGSGAEETLAEGSEKATSLDPASEYFYLSDHDPDLKMHVKSFLGKGGTPDKYPHLKDWLHAPWLGKHITQANLGIVQGAAQQRQIGRFAMFQNADRIIARIGGLIRDLDLHARGSGVNVWIIGSTAGGTGAGCLLDAAYLTHLAAGHISRKINGVIVLPNVYMGIGGISEGRAYSLLRELDRAQGQGIPEDDSYLLDGEAVWSHVNYDAALQRVAHVDNRLFDDLFYLGSECRTEQQRKRFFTSVANSIDPYLDVNSGPRLLEAAVNETAAASSFGAARVYVPVETFSDMFAWEEVADYLRGAAAVNEEGDRISLYYGAADDRRTEAASKVKGILALFGELLARQGKTATDNEAYARQSLDPEQIVTKWYQFAGLAIAGDSMTDTEAQIVRLTYLNPYLSFTEIDLDKIELKDQETKTYKENKEARGVKESQEESRNRFAARLEEITLRYTSATGGERSFERGRKMVFDKVSLRLKNVVDKLIIDELTRATSFSADLERSKQGTTLTRLNEEIQYILEDRNGPLNQVDEIVGQFIKGMEQNKASRDNQAVEALRTLRSSRKTGMFDLGWVESYQVTAREECAEYVNWYQKYRLLQDMQQIVRIVKKRFDDWNRTIGGMLNSLALDEGEEYKASCLFLVKVYRLKKFTDRLYRAARNPSALISFNEEPDQTMMGYRQYLRDTIGKLATDLLSRSRWEATVREDGTPELTLVINGRRSLPFAKETVRNLPQALHEYFQEDIDKQLVSKDIFDFLLYVQKNHNIQPETIAKKLNEACESLINAGGIREEWMLVYKDPSGDEKKNLAAAIQGQVLKLNSDGTRDPERAHSDGNSITLLKVKKPGLEHIDDIRTSREDYLKLMVEELSGDKHHDDKILRAQVFHPFRPELEAWWIERYAYRKSNHERPKDKPPIVPRVVRLLEDPSMMQAFVQCVAAGAIERVTDTGWIWHSDPNDPSKDVRLTEDDRTKNDVIAAANTFVLEKREKKRRTRITWEEAIQSFTAIVNSKGMSRREVLEDFRNNKLKKFLEGHLFKVGSDREQANIKDSLTLVFDFYCDPDVRTSIQDRMELP